MVNPKSCATSTEKESGMLKDNVIECNFEHSENKEEFCLFDFPKDISLEMKEKMVQNFNWLFMSDGAKEEDVHG